MNYADLHCDTLTAAFGKGMSLADADTDVSLDKASCFDGYIQVAAIFTSHNLTNEEGFARFTEVADYARREEASHDGRLALCKSGSEITRALDSRKAAFVISVEDARILAGDINRLEVLHENGVRIITPLWSGLTCIGGSFDTDEGLTDFGRAVIDGCLDFGIIPDISHASVRSADEILSTAEKRGVPVIASHSDSYSVNAHPRNLRDDQLLRIISLGGLVGLNMYPLHVSGGDSCTMDDIAKHLYRYLELGAEDCIAFGCDLDGIGEHPDGVNTVSDIPDLVAHFRSLGIDGETLDKLAFKNAYGFLTSNVR